MCRLCSTIFATHEKRKIGGMHLIEMLWLQKYLTFFMIWGQIFMFVGNPSSKVHVARYFAAACELLMRPSL